MTVKHPFGVIDGGRPDHDAPQIRRIPSIDFPIVSHKKNPEEKRSKTLSDLPFRERGTSGTVHVIRQNFDDMVQNLLQDIASQGQSDRARNGEWLIYIYQGSYGFTCRKLNGDAVAHRTWIEHGQKDRLMTVLDPLLQFSQQWPVDLAGIEDPHVFVKTPVISQNICRWVNGQSKYLLREQNSRTPHPEPPHFTY